MVEEKDEGNEVKKKKERDGAKRTPKEEENKRERKEKERLVLPPSLTRLKSPIPTNGRC